MLYMVIERFSNRDAMAVYRRFREKGRMTPEGLRYVDSWVETSYDRCLQLLKDPDFNPSYSQIADFTQVTRIELSAQDIHELAQRSVFSPLSRRALIVPNDVAYGLGRMFEMLRQNHGEMKIRVFRNLGDALNWVFLKSATA